MYNKKVIYTALFGERGRLLEPDFVSEGWDFICFTDRDDLASQTWKIVKEKALDDRSPRKSAKIYKILPHKYFSQYELSLWIDANLVVRGDINELIQKYKQNSFVAFSHAYSVPDSRDCIYEELNSLLEMNKKGRHRDVDDVMISQVERYRQDGYPEHNGLIVGMFLLRRHNDSLVKKTMEDWWQEIQHYSIRDQLSCNYVAWKNGLPIMLLNGDSRNNEYVRYTPHNKTSFSKKIVRKVRRLFFLK